jgi:RNA polymerase sigma-70 factor (ECF subfamily)
MVGASAEAQDHHAANDADFGDFFRHSHHRVCRTLLALGGDARNVEDVTQEAFILARHRWTELRNYQKPEAWVMKVALQLLRRWHARERRFDTEPTSESATIFDSLPADGGTWEIHQAILRLPRRRAETIVLRALGYSVAETAEILAIRPGTVKTHLCLARRDLCMLLGTDQEVEREIR